MDQNITFGQANAQLQAGRLDEADALCTQLLVGLPNHPDVLQMRGVIQLQRGDFESALHWLDRTIALQPEHPAAHVNRAAALIGLGRPEDALASAERAISIAPRSLASHNNMISALNQLGRASEAISAAERVLALGLEDAKLHLYRASAYFSLARFEEAVAAADRAIALDRSIPDGHGYRAHALMQLHRMSEAAESHAQALALAPSSAEGHFSHAVALVSIRKYMEAIESCDRALAFQPSYYEALHVRATALHWLDRFDEAIADINRALRLQPDYARGYALRGVCYAESKRPELALADYETALDLEPGMMVIPGQCAYLQLQSCNWDGLDERMKKILSAIDNGNYAVQPLHTSVLPASPGQQQIVATCGYKDTFPPPFREIRGSRAFNEKLRVGYFSSDLGNHPVGNLMVGLIEAHNRSQFEVVSVSFGSDVKDATRLRIEKSSDAFVEAQGLTPEEIATLARKMNIHIAVDLNGYTKDMRPRIFSIGAAPIQVNYLGFPGTLGNDRIHYIIGDEIVTPPEHYPFYTERVVTMPHSYFLTNDIKQKVPARVSLRAEFGLSDSSFVFCCFNATQKITPDAYDSWMRLLRSVDNSVLWLNDPGVTGSRNLRREARSRGVLPERIIFARRTPGLEYLARYRLADLFLDTFYYNAHATGAESLMMGLPVVTRLGQAFAGRVGASLLTAVGLQDLIATDTTGYERIALRLAQEPGVLKEVRERLCRNLATYPLFDTRRYARNLETAYLEMWRRYEKGLAPDHIRVAEGGEAVA